MAKNLINKPVPEEEEEKNLEKFECPDCGCYYLVKDRDGFICPNCEDEYENSPAVVGRVLKEWKVSDMNECEHIGLFEFDDIYGEWHTFELFETKERIVFGGFCNAGFLESGYIEKSGRSTDNTLNELYEDLKTYYDEGAEFTTEIVFNERM